MRVQEDRMPGKSAILALMVESQLNATDPLT